MGCVCYDMQRDVDTEGLDPRCGKPVTESVRVTRWLKGGQVFDIRTWHVCSGCASSLYAAPGKVGLEPDEVA